MYNDVFRGSFRLVFWWFIIKYRGFLNLKLGIYGIYFIISFLNDRGFLCVFCLLIRMLH